MRDNVKYPSLKRGMIFNVINGPLIFHSDILDSRRKIIRDITTKYVLFRFIFNLII